MMHDDEIAIDEPLVRRLIVARRPDLAELAGPPGLASRKDSSSSRPDLAELPLARVDSAGTVNAIFRLGDDLAVRLPLVSWGADEIELTSHWLKPLRSRLPLATPEALEIGEPALGYPWKWSIERWLPGANPGPDLDLARAASDLGEFIVALQRISPDGAPRSSRGGPLSARDPDTRSAIAQLENDYDTSVLTRAWDRALAQPAWDGPPTWYHGDLMPGNLLARDGRLSAVIDWGCLGVGDPACDLMAAWTLLDEASRPVFRRIVKCDDASWERGRGWALTCGIQALPYYRTSNPVFAAVAKRMIDEALL